MSKESFQEFVTKLQSDAGLQQELRKIGDPEKGIPSDKLAAFAAGKGYKFRVEEMTGELSDNQLDAVNGGAYDAFMKFGSAGKVFPKVEFQKIVFNFSRIFNKY